VKKTHVSVTYVVLWPGEEITTIVRADVLPELVEVRDFLPPLRSAITEWIRTTDKGRMVWEENNESFIVGDLAKFNDEKLNELLANVGILKLEVYGTLGEKDWTYEDSLVDDTPLGT
jgi:hypothetical protein